MSGGDLTAIFIAFAAYLIFMVIIGALYMKKTESVEDSILGGRGLSGWVAAFSAQASDMSGWLLMGLPGAIYAAGTGQIWIAVGLFCGTVFNWVCISSRLRRYTIKANNSLTLPAFFENRYRDEKKILLLIGLLAVPIIAYVLVGGSDGARELITESGVVGGADAFLNPLMNGDRPYTFAESWRRSCPPRILSFW